MQPLLLSRRSVERKRERDLSSRAKQLPFTSVQERQGPNEQQRAPMSGICMSSHSPSLPRDEIGVSRLTLGSYERASSLRSIIAGPAEQSVVARYLLELLLLPARP